MLAVLLLLWWALTALPELHFLYVLVSLGEVPLLEALLLPWHWPAAPATLGIGLGVAALVFWDGPRARRLAGFGLVVLLALMGLQLAGQVPRALAIRVPWPLGFFERSWLGFFALNDLVLVLASLQITLHLWLRSHPGSPRPDRLSRVLSLLLGLLIAVVFPVVRVLTFSSLRTMGESVSAYPVAFIGLDLLRPIVVPLVLALSALVLPRRLVRDGLAFALLATGILGGLLYFTSLGPSAGTWAWWLLRLGAGPLDLVLVFMLLEWRSPGALSDEER